MQTFDDLRVIAQNFASSDLTPELLQRIRLQRHRSYASCLVHLPIMERQLLEECADAYDEALFALKERTDVVCALSLLAYASKLEHEHSIGEFADAAIALFSEKEQEGSPMPMPHVPTQPAHNLRPVNITALRDAGLGFVLSAAENMPITLEMLLPYWLEYCSIMERAGIDLRCDFIVHQEEGRLGWVPRI